MKKIYLLLLTLLISVASIGQTAIFINEIHYDNAGADVNEGIEIAGPAGTDLSTYTITPYNGNGGVPYSATTLSGTIPNEGGTGYGTVFFAISGLQNDGPDGVALDNGGTLIQFLSYEGSFMGASGVAMNVTSTDIGVSESNSTAIGQSLQLSGAGTTYEDFAWSAPASHSRGGINISQTFGTAPIINANPTSISGLTYLEGNGPSNEDTFVASGANLFTDVTVSAPTNFEISLASGTAYTDSILLEAVSGTVATTTIYVRMITGLAINTYTGDIELTSPGAADRTLSLSGEVTAPLSNDTPESSDFSIYPNPTSTGFVNIKTNSGDSINVQVFNVLGKRVLSQSVNNEQLSVSTLKTGIYIMKISQGKNTTTKKLVIK